MPTCPNHAAEEIAGSCARCGDFVCRLDGRTVEKELLCLRCAPLREADHLERFRRELHGRMDLPVVLFGIFCPILTGVLIWWAPPLEAAFGIGGIAIFCAYLLRKAWARVALFALPAAAIGLAIPHGPGAVLAALVAGVIPTAMIASAYASPRNRLAFGLEVGRRDLAKLYDASRNNPRAQESVLLAILGLAFPPALVLSLALAVYGLTRVDPHASPPVGKRGHALVGIAISLAGIALYVVLILRTFKY